MHAIWGPFAPDLVESGEREMEQLWEGLSTAVLGVCLGLLQMFGYSLEVKVKALSKGPRYIYGRYGESKKAFDRSHLQVGSFEVGR